VKTQATDLWVASGLSKWGWQGGFKTRLQGTGGKKLLQP